ncbi:telomerase-binding protein EST1A-like [Stylophora pistillata]|nr:telomerase-binding protein EST1A-like [Stylophora pistillata]
MNGGSSISSGLYGPVHAEKSVSPNKEVRFITVDEKTTEPQNEVSTTIGKFGDKHSEVNNVYSGESVNIHNTSIENEVVYETKAEKTLKSINQQKAQRLKRAVSPKEAQLSNLLSRGTLDKAVFAKICSLSKEIQDTYKGIMMLDIGQVTQLEVDQNLWKNAFYKVIETLRKYGKLFLGYEEKSDVLSPDEITNCLKEFLKDAETFYKSLLELLQKEHDFSIQEIVNQPRKAEKLGKNAKLALMSSQHILISLGDIERYQVQFQPHPNWASIRSWYLKANKLAPKNGKPYNQLGVIAVSANRKLDSVYYYIRSLAVSNPILTAREKLTAIFHDIQVKADRIQRTEDQKKALSEQQIHQKREKSRSSFGEAAKVVGLKSDHKSSHGRHEMWIFMCQGKYRKVVVTDHGKVQEVNSRGEPILEGQTEEHSSDPVKESPKISLQEVNKKFMLHYLCAHGLLYSRIGMERLPTLQYQLLGEFHTLLEYPSCSAISRSNLLQMMAINMFAIEHTASQDVSEPYVRVGTPQDQAMNLAVEMFIMLLKACCALLLKIDFEARNTYEGLSDTLHQFLPSVKVFADWVVCHVDLWQVSSISTHRSLWESVSQFTNAISYVDIDDLHDDDANEMVTLSEDEFLAGFKPLSSAVRPLCRVPDANSKSLAEDYLRCQRLKEFAAFLVSLEHSPLEFDNDKGEFSAMIKSTPVSPVKESQVMVHLDTSPQNEHEDSDEEADVIIESEEEQLDSGDEVEKDLKELKAKKDALKKQVEIHKEREDRAKAVIEEHISKPRLMFENYPTYLVPDTNCFVDHLDGVKAIVASQEFTLVVPLIVINELDGLKKDVLLDKCDNLQHAQYVLENARLAIHFLENDFSQRNPQVKTVTSKGTELDTIQFRSEDPSGRKGKGCNDDVILSCCLHYCEENFINRLATANQPITIQRKVVLLTDDRNLRVKAYTRNVPVLTIPQFRQMARL